MDIENSLPSWSCYSFPSKLILNTFFLSQWLSDDNMNGLAGADLWHSSGCDGRWKLHKHSRDIDG